jgi:sulfoxide reductase heme-binding subunit YedZ
MTLLDRALPPSPSRPEPAGGYPVGLLAGGSLAMLALVAAAAVMGRSVSPVTWYVARASGIVLYLVLWLSVVAGLGLTTSLLDRWGGRGMVFSLHAFTTQLAYGFLALHLLSLAADPTVRFGPRDLLVPFAATVREPWTGCGVLAGELTVIIGVSFSVKRLIGQRAWRALHWLTFPLYALALLHGLGAGTDTRTPWMATLYLATGATVVLFSGYRLLRRGSRTRAASSPSATAPRSVGVA